MVLIYEGIHLGGHRMLAIMAFILCLMYWQCFKCTDKQFALDDESVDNIGETNQSFVKRYLWSYLIECRKIVSEWSFKKIWVKMVLRKRCHDKIFENRVRRKFLVILSQNTLYSNRYNFKNGSSL